MLRNKRERGQSLVEFMITVPVILLFIFGVFDLVRLFHVKIVVVNAAREGARYLVIYPSDKDNSFAGTIAAATRESGSGNIALTAANVSITQCLDTDTNNSCDRGFPIEVTVSHNVELGLLGFLVGDYPVSGKVRMMVP